MSTLRTMRINEYTVYTLESYTISNHQEINLEEWHKYDAKNKKETKEWRVSKYSVQYGETDEDEPKITCIERREYKSRNAAANRIRKVINN